MRSIKDDEPLKHYQPTDPPTFPSMEYPPLSDREVDEIHKRLDKKYKSKYPPIEDYEDSFHIPNDPPKSWKSLVLPIIILAFVAGLLIWCGLSAFLHIW